MAHKRTSLAALTLLIGTSAAASSTIIYAPPHADNPGKMSSSEARQVITKKLLWAGMEPPTLILTREKLTFRQKWVEGWSTCEYSFGSSPEPVVVRENQFSNAMPKIYMTEPTTCQIQFDTVENARRFADAIQVFNHDVGRDFNAEAEADAVRFQSVVTEYRKHKTPPAISEEVHRYQVMAETKFDEKKYNESAAFYRKGLEISPWWPAGHFNLALVLSHEEDYPGAVVEMKKYLALVPNAKDARSAHDRIYTWEAKGN